MEAEQLLMSEFLGAHPEDAARLLEDWPLQEAAAVLDSVSADSAADVLGKMGPFAAAGCLSKMPGERAGLITAILPVGTAVGLLRRMERQDRTDLFESLPSERRATLELLLRYPEGTAGSLMDPLVGVLPDDITVEEAVRRIKSFSESKHLYDYLYVLDRSQVLVGVVGLEQLMLAPPDEPVDGLMATSVASVNAYASFESVRAHPGWRNFHALPVVDEKGVFVGAMRHTVLRRIEDESTARDTQKGLETIFALGELYWVGLCELFGGLSSPSGPGQESKKR